MRARIPAFLCLLLAPLAAHAQDPVIDTERLSDNIRILSSDEFEGRAPATPGEDRTVEFLIARFKEAGLEPGAGDKSWTQDVTLRRIEIDGPMTMTLQADGASATLVQGDDVAVATRRATDAVEVKDAPLVFVGYGVHAPERDWDDFKGMDLAGKIALVLINDPDFEVETGGRFDGKAMTYYGRWTYKYEELARRGALGALIIHETEPASYGWATVKNSFTGPQYTIADSEEPFLPIEAWITLQRATEILKRAGLSFARLKEAAKRPDFKPIPLRDMTLTSSFRVKTDEVTSRNVIGRIPGTERPDETILYTAHWDHLGRGTGEGDQIFNGAVDNATGTAGLIELAHAFKAGPPPKRSIVFIALTAEEQGLLGAEHYAAHPVYPLEKTVALINMDTLSVFGPAREMEVIGYGKSALEKILEEVATKEEIRIVRESRPEAGFFYRSDHFALAKKGVPSLYVSLGLDLVEGGVEAGRKASEQYIAERYHQPGDEWSADWDLGGAAQELRVLYGVGRRLADSADWPEWNDSAEFKAARDKSADQRR